MDLTQDFKDTILALSEAVARQQESAAAMMYRLMFRHERNINILDKYADQILGGIAGMGSRYAEEDYLNLLQYLQHEIPEEYESHKRLYEFDKHTADDED